VNEQEVIAFWKDQIGDDKEKLRAALVIRDTLNYARDNLYQYKIFLDLRERNKIHNGSNHEVGKVSRYEKMDKGCVWISIWGLSYEEYTNFECKIWISPRSPYDTRQLIEITPEDKTVDVNGLMKIAEKQGINGLRKRSADCDSLHYVNYEEGTQYLDNEERFYEVVEDIANRLLSLRAAQ